MTTISPRRTTPGGSPRTERWPARPSRRGRPEAPLTPMYRELLGPTVVDALAALERDLPASEFRADTLAWLARHFRPEATVAGSYRDALAELLAPLGRGRVRQHPSRRQARRRRRYCWRRSAVRRARGRPRVACGGSGGRRHRLRHDARRRRDAGDARLPSGSRPLDAARRPVHHPSGQGCPIRWPSSRRSPHGSRSDSRRTCCCGPWSRARCSRRSRTWAGRGSSAISRSRRRCTPGSASRSSGRCRAGRGCWWSRGLRGCWRNSACRSTS